MAVARNPKGLTPKQALFVQEYLVDLNGTQAAIRAGYSARTARGIACEHLTKPNIAKAVQAGFAIRAQKVTKKATLENVVEELTTLGFSSMRDFVRWGPKGIRLRPSGNLGEKARCVKEVSQTKFKGETTVTFKLHDKVGALDKLGRHLGMYAESDGRTLAQGAIALDLFRRMMDDAQNGKTSANGHGRAAIEGD